MSLTFISKSQLNPCTIIVISAMKIERGLALQDLIIGAYDYVESIEFQPHARVYLLDSLATTEFVFLPC
jgi:hypothetical protein